METWASNKQNKHEKARNNKPNKRNMKKNT